MGVGKEATAKMIAARRTLLFLIMEGMRVLEVQFVVFASDKVLEFCSVATTSHVGFFHGQAKRKRSAFSPLSPPKNDALRIGPT